MDWSAAANRITGIIGKYRYVIFVLALGIILMSLPKSGTDVPEEPLPDTNDGILSASEELEAILAQIDGVGRVKVLLTEYSGRETIYQTDTDSSTSADVQSMRSETVIVSNSDRAETGLVRQVNPPLYLGAVVVCQGADRAEVQLGIVEAVSDVTGISTDRITVLKMK